MTSTDKVAETTRALMGMQRKKVSEMALLLGVTRQTASLFYNGHKAMDSDQISILAKWLGASEGAFFKGVSYERLAT